MGGTLGTPLYIYSFQMMLIVVWFGVTAKVPKVRKSRINAPGAMHHIIARGIERCKIFRDDADCNNFLDRLEGVCGQRYLRGQAR